MDCAHGLALARSASVFPRKWYSVWKRFRRWALKGVFEKIFKVLSGDQDFEYAMIDGTIIKVHRHGTGAKGGLSVRPSAVHAAG